MERIYTCKFCRENVSKEDFVEGLCPRCYKAKWNCVFDQEIKCPAKKAFKLVPESLVEFCKVCTVSPVNVSQHKRIAETFLQLTVTMADLQRDLGKQTALAEVYQKLYEEAKDPFKHFSEKLEQLRRLKEIEPKLFPDETPQ